MYIFSLKIVHIYDDEKHCPVGMAMEVSWIFWHCPVSSVHSNV